MAALSRNLDSKFYQSADTFCAAHSGLGLTFDDLLTTLSREAAEPALKQELAVTLMGYARANPDTIRGRAMPVIVYDPATGRDAFAVTMRKILE